MSRSKSQSHINSCLPAIRGRIRRRGRRRRRPDSSPPPPPPPTRCGRHHSPTEGRRQMPQQLRRATAACAASEIMRHPRVFRNDTNYNNRAGRAVPRSKSSPGRLRGRAAACGNQRPGETAVMIWPRYLAMYLVLDIYRGRYISYTWY